MQSHIRKVYVCLAVTCHLHFWQNDRDLLRATAVTRGWNGYRNKSQYRKSTLEKKILPPLLSWRERRTEADLNRRTAYQPNALPLGQTGSLEREECRSGLEPSGRLPPGNALTLGQPAHWFNPPTGEHHFYLRMWSRLSFCTFYLLAGWVIDAVDDSGLCCCVPCYTCRRLMNDQRLTFPSGDSHYFSPSICPATALVAAHLNAGIILVVTA